MKSSNQTVFAGTQDGILRSTDNGLTWAASNTGLDNTDVWSLEMKDASVFAGTSTGIFRSTNNGTAWEIADSTLTNLVIESLHFNGDYLFAGTGSAGILRSGNNGSTWTSVNQGLSDNHILSVVSNAGQLYTGTAGMGVFASTDHGMNWHPLAAGVYPIVRALAYFAGNIYAGGGGGIFRSTDNGSSWTSVSFGLTNDFIMNFAVYQSNIFACGWGGVYVSTDSGSTWTEINAGLPQGEIRSIVIAGTTILAGVDSNGIWKRPLGDVITSTEYTTSSTPKRYAIKQNFPNPFNPVTEIQYSIPKASHVRIVILNSLGQQIMKIVDRTQPAGDYKTKVDLRESGSGTYFYRLETESFRQTRKMILAK